MVWLDAWQKASIAFLTSAHWASTLEVRVSAGYGIFRASYCFWKLSTMPATGTAFLYTAQLIFGVSAGLARTLEGSNGEFTIRRNYIIDGGTCRELTFGGSRRIWAWRLLGWPSARRAPSRPKRPSLQSSERSFSPFSWRFLGNSSKRHWQDGRKFVRWPQTNQPTNHGQKIKRQK